MMKKKKFVFKIRFKTRPKTFKMFQSSKLQQGKTPLFNRPIVELNNQTSMIIKKSTAYFKPDLNLLLTACLILLLISYNLPQASSMLMMMMTTNCLSQTPTCSCSWKSGKFVADCSNQSLNQVPKNDYYDYLLANSGNNQMPTLNRDIQQLNLAQNVIVELKSEEFSRKKFRNLQKIYLNSNQIKQIDLKAFHKLTGLIELDLSDNLISKLTDDQPINSKFDYLQDDESDISLMRGLNDSLNETKMEDRMASSSSLEQQRQQQQTTSSKRRYKLLSRKSFLQDLSQLRQLNLTSNQLTRIEEFTFSPMTQLRQLFLSRNKISFIDKNAFDGLNVLNILHLDGNKLSQLDGEILVKLPALHSVKLAAGNRWQCDCKLRKLVRFLLSPEGKEVEPLMQHWSGTNYKQLNSNNNHSTNNKHIGKLSTPQVQRTNILQDEPRCASTSIRRKSDQVEGKASQSMSDVDFVRPSMIGRRRRGSKSYDSDDNNDKDNDNQGEQQEGGEEGEEEGIAWKNLKLSEFDCAPLAAIEFMSLEATSTSASGKTDTSYESAYQIGQSSNNGSHNNDKQLNSSGSSGILTSQTSKAPQMVKLDTQTGDDKGRQLHDDFVEVDDDNEDVDDDKDKDKVRVGIKRANLKRTLKLLKLEPAYYMPIEPLELTCAFYINDELDLDLTRVEWWQLNANSGFLDGRLGDSSNNEKNHKKSKPQNILLWRFNGTQRWLKQTKLKDEAIANGGGSSGEEYAIIDYVTRANGSRLMSSSYDDSPSYDGGDQTATTTIPEGDQQESDSERKVRDKEEPIELVVTESRVATQTQSQTGEEFPRNIVRSSQILPSATTFSSIKKPSGGDRVAGATSEQLARVIHLIVNPLFDSGETQQIKDRDSETSPNRSSIDQVRREYLCRITNKIGRLDIVYTIHIDSNSNLAHFEAEKRQFLRRKLIDDKSTSQTINSNWPKSLFNNNNNANEAFDLSSSSSRVLDPTRLVDEAKSLIIKELNNKEDFKRRVTGTTLNSPLFIPVHLPKDLLHNQLNNSSSNLESSAREFSLARSLQNQNQNQNQDHQQRTATRQTNGTNILMANLLASQSQPQSPQTTNTVIHVAKGGVGGGLNSSQENSKWPLKRSINSIAFDLISRYTSNKRSLIFGNGNEQDLSGLDLTNNPFSSRGYLSDYDSGKPLRGDVLTNIIEILRANEKPLNVRLLFVMKLIVPEKMLNFLISWQQQISLVILMFTCVTITVFLTSLCRRDKVADSSNISTNSTIKKKRKRSNKVRSGWRRNKSTTYSQKPHISIIDIDQQEEEEQQQLSPPSASTGNELDEYVQQSSKEAQINRPESGSAITTTNGSQVKLINSNTSSDESQLRFNNSDISRQNGIILTTTTTINSNINNLNNGSSESQQHQQLQLDESILNSLSSQLNEHASNQFHRFISSGGDSLSPSDEMNTELENDVSGNLEADNEDGTSHSRCKINGGYKLEKSHSSSLDQSDISCFKQINYGLQQYTGNNSSNSNKFLADKYRLIMVSPQEELQELLVSPQPPHYCPDGDMMSHYHPQQKQLEIASANPSMLLQHDSAYYLVNQNIIEQQQQQLQKVQSNKLERQQVYHYLSPQNGQQQQYGQNDLFWPIPDGCKETTVGPSFAGLASIHPQQELQGHQNQVQQQYFIAPPPKMRSLRENNGAFHVNIGNNQNFTREQQQQQHQQSFQPKALQRINMTLPARKNLSRISPSFASSSNNEQLTSSSSPAASTSSSLTPATGCFSQGHAQQVNNQYSRQQLGRNQNAQYLEDALQLLDSSVNNCLLPENRYKIER